MARQRERFERTDVPRESPYRNVVGALVCVAVVVAVVVTVALTRDRVQLESRLGDVALTEALDGQVRAGTPSAEGYVPTTDDVETVLLLTADSLDATGSALVSARVLALDRTQGTAALANVPTEAKMVADDAATTLGELFSAQGYAACVAPLATASGVGFDHVILATEDVVGSVAALAGTPADSLLREASGLLSQIRTDMDAAELVDLAAELSQTGAAGVAVTDVALVPETATDADGNVTETGYQLVDGARLCVALGLLVSAA